MKNFIWAAVFALSCSQAAASSSLGYFKFSQGGFPEDATVSGYFYGHDLNGDGQLSSFDGEVDDFEMFFSGNSNINPFSLGRNDLFGLVYDMNGGPLGDGQILDIEGIGAGFLFSYSYAAGPGPVALCGQGQDCAYVTDGNNTDYSQELVQVEGTVSHPVPTLAPFGLLLLSGLLAVFGLNRSRD